MTWASEADLLTGDMDLGSIDTQMYLDRAADEINIWLGGFYDLDTAFPTIGGTPALTSRMEAALRLTQGRIASGRLIMAQCAGSQDEQLHAYGLWLLGLGMDDMHKFGGEWQIEGATLLAGQEASDLMPSIHQPNKRSAFDRYEKTFYDDEDGPSFEETGSSYVQQVTLSG